MYRSSLRDGLLDYVEILKQDALDGFRHAQALYVAGGLKESPSVPDILKVDTE